MTTSQGLVSIEARGLEPGRFHDEILPAARPTILRGLVRHWPVVAAGRASPAALVEYVKRFDRSVPVGAMMGPPGIAGRFHYNDDLSGFNFRRSSVRLAAGLDLLLEYAGRDNPPSLAIQSVPVRDNLPGFEAENPLPLLGGAVEPRVWIGNAVTVAAHHDPSENIACVAAGRRRFTLLPPDQISNLYMGPFELTPAGPAVSMVDFSAPDFARHPRFRAALEASITAELEPGDALYIPYLWWHQVESLDPLNMLVNYWWAPPDQGRGRPLDALMHAILALRDLPPPHRAAWKSLFDHYVFEVDGPAADHLPADRRGVQGPLDRTAILSIRAALARALGRPS